MQRHFIHEPKKKSQSSQLKRRIFRIRCVYVCVCMSLLRMRNTILQFYKKSKSVGKMVEKKTTAAIITTATEHPTITKNKSSYSLYEFPIANTQKHTDTQSRLCECVCSLKPIKCVLPFVFLLFSTNSLQQNCTNLQHFSSRLGRLLHTLTLHIV